MPSFVVDPLLCTLPEAGAGADETRAFLEDLDAWLTAVEGSPFAWRHFLACTRALEEVGRFPTFTSLRAARQVAGADVNIAGLLQRIARFFQDDDRDLLSVTATQCAVVAEPEPSIAPPDLAGRNLPEVRAPLRDGLLCLACDKAAGEAFAKEAHVVTRPFAEPVREVSIEGTVSLVEPEGMTKRLEGVVLAARFRVVFSPDDLSDFHYEALLAGGADGLPALVTSIAAASYPGASLLPLRTGGQLWRTLEKTGIIEDRFATTKLLRVCAAIVAGRWEGLSVSRRDLREKQAADSPQRTRKSDGAKAWRMTITKEGAGYRLHYWHRPVQPGQVEQIELANVLRERDPKVIPEG